MGKFKRILRKGAWVLCTTQEEYNLLMFLCEVNDIKWVTGARPEKLNAYESRLRMFGSTRCSIYFTTTGRIAWEANSLQAVKLLNYPELFMGGIQK